MRGVAAFDDSMEGGGKLRELVRGERFECFLIDLRVGRFLTASFEAVQLVTVSVCDGGLDAWYCRSRFAGSGYVV